MKKVFLLFVFVAVYGVSMAMSNSSVVSVNNMQTTIVADMTDNNVVAPDTEKEKEKAKGTEAKAAKSEGCGTAKSEGCGGTAKSEGCADKAKSASTEKKEGSK
jgi:hypothetical protein